MAEKKSILKSGRMTETMKYTVNVKGVDVHVRESLNLDTENGNFFKTDRIIIKSSRHFGNRWSTLPLDSDIGRAVMADEDGARGNAFRNAYDTFSTNEKTEDALRDSGMYELARGSVSHTGTEFPDNTINKDDGVKEEGKQEDTRPKVKPHFNRDPENLKYPSDMSLDQDYIFIESFEYSAPQQQSLRQNSAERIPNRVRKGIFESHASAKARSMKPKYKLVDKRDAATKKEFGFANTAATGLSRGSNVKEFRGSVKLPIPNAIKSSNGVDWGEARVNALEAGAFMGVQNQISGVLGGSQNIAGALKSGVDGLKETFDKLPEIGKGQSGQLISSVLSKTVLSQVGLNVDPSQMIARSTGMAINPNLELLFSSPKLRTFTFVFQFAPDDEIDATATRKIQRFFKQGMLPTNAAGDAGEKLYLGSPNVFRLCYKNQGKRIKGLNVFKICALTACEINFTPENVYQAYDDPEAVSMPVRSFMTLTFTELTPIFANDYDHNFVSKNVDPSLADLGLNIAGENTIKNDDIGF
tara:strand:+ start:2854 stop:4434 length:1581 start_codon:yes stop_codon:yes gene_type:complete